MNSESCAITDSSVFRVGTLYPSAIGISCSGKDSKACKIIHNQVHETPYTAIACSGNEHCIERNVILDFMQELDDGAAIYITFCKDIMVCHNSVEGTSGRIASAYYLDEQAEGCVVEKNLAFNTRWPSHNHMARDCIIRNNVFIDDNEMKLTFHRCRGFTLEKNILYANGAILIRSPRDGIATMPKNIFFSCADTIEMETLENYTSSQRSPLLPRDGTVFENPLFEDMEHGDFTFQADSHAESLGIEPYQ